MADVASDVKADVTADSTAVTSVPASGGTSAAVTLCPNTGLWAECSILYRLDRSGLVPRLDSSAQVAEAPLTVKGRLVRIGNSELELYLYADIASREREQRSLDRAKYVEYPAPVPMNPVPTLISSANLIAILHSRNDHQRERVSDALTAGPPQPSSKRP